MAKLYTDEDFDYPVVTQLRLLSHDVLTAQQAGQAQQRVPDPAALAFAVAQGRALLTYNRRHFIRLSPAIFVALRHHCLHQGR